MRSPDRKLLPSDISRKKKKLDKTLKQLDGLTEGTRKHHRKMFKAEKTLDQVRTGKSGIRPTKSPLNMLGISRKEVNKDSIASVNAWAQHKKSYMDRKFKGNDERLGPITPEQNKAEYDREKNEFYYDTNKKKLRLIPTDDGEVQDRTGIKDWQLAPDRKSKKLKAGKDANYNRRDKDSYFYDEDFAADAGPTSSRQELNKKRKETRDNTLSKKKSPINLNDPYAGQYEAGAGGGADYFSNAEDFQNLFSSIGDAFSKAYTPENRAKYQEKRADRREERGKKKFKKNILEEFNVTDKQGQPIGENKERVAFEKKTKEIRDRAAENKAKALLAKKKKDQES